MTQDACDDAGVVALDLDGILNFDLHRLDTVVSFLLAFAVHPGRNAG